MFANATASGMSSSSAFMIGVFLVLAAVNDLSASPAYLAAISNAEALAGYLATIENGRSFGALEGDRGVGTFGGSEDHTAILCCRPATLSQYRFAPVSLEREVPMPAGHVFVVAFSGVLAEKTGDALDTYNLASRCAARVLKIWQQASGRTDATLEAAASAEPGAPDEIRRAIAAAHDKEFGADRLTKRFDQFVLESGTIIPAAGDALVADDLVRFGELVDRSQDAVERCRHGRSLDLSNETPFVNDLPERSEASQHSVARRAQHPFPVEAADCLRLGCIFLGAAAPQNTAHAMPAMSLDHCMAVDSCREPRAQPDNHRRRVHS